MPPKKAGNNNNNTSKKAAAGKKGKKEESDDDDALLMAASQAAQKAGKELEAKKSVEKKKEQEKKEKQEKLEKAMAIQKAVAIAKLPPLYVDEVAKALYEMKGGDNQKDSFREMSWLAFALYNFINRVCETNRKLLIRPAASALAGTDEGAEPLKSFEVHDVSSDENSPHSWNVFTTVSDKQYAVELTLKQFDTKGGRYGVNRDGQTEVPAWAAVAGPSRLIPLQKAEGAEEGALHVGTRATDGGIFPNARAETIVAEVQQGDALTKAYLHFLKCSNASRFQGMTPAEDKAARILSRNTSGASAQKLSDTHESLEAQFFTKPLDAAAKAEKAAKAESKE